MKRTLAPIRLSWAHWAVLVATLVILLLLALVMGYPLLAVELPSLI